MSDKTWKAYERRIAALLGGRRVSILQSEDIEHPVLSIECTVQKQAKIPALVRNKYEQALRNCPEGKKPVVVMKEKNRNDLNSFVILSLGDFHEIFRRAYEMTK